MAIKNILKKYHNFHDAVITRIEIENPNNVSENGSTSVKPNFKIKMYLDYFQNAKLSDVKESQLLHFELICPGRNQVQIK